MTAGDNYPKIFPGIGGGVLVACLSAAGCLWTGVWWLVWIWSALVVQLTYFVQVDMDDLQIVSYVDYYSVYTFNIHVPYLIVFD